jgi:hypothetical protein
MTPSFAAQRKIDMRLSRAASNDCSERAPKLLTLEKVHIQAFRYVGERKLIFRESGF